ncbi:hypothetical protein H6504_00340 [Candidatus Woesearchaeota archaeon]|nr:hypothetical protein [Candidatus Woesearchaeota archaeon]
MNDATTYKDRVYWNSRTYGTAVIIPKNSLRAAMTIFCICTPFTNWLLLFIHQIKKDIVFRY